jgi:tetratricopeptide (TPR) repeat protein
MSSVDKETFAYWVTHPHDIGASNLSRLEATAQAYPYCQITHSLIAKVGSDSNSPQIHKYISLAAVHTLNRGALRRLVENEFVWSESLLNRLNDLPLGRSVSRDTAAPYGNDKPISLIRFEDRFAKSPEPGERPEPLERQPEVLPMDETVASEKAIEEDLTHKRLIVAPIPAIELLPLPIPKENERRKQQEIIENFIKNDPRIGPIRVKGEEAEKEPVDLSSRAKVLPTDGLATESFAKILIRQGKLDKAIDIYEKLMLKNPKKNDYFAEKIAELKAGK